VDSVEAMRVSLPEGRTLSWAPDWPYRTGDRTLVAEAHAWLAGRTMVAVNPTGPYVEATLAEPLAAYIAIRTVTPAASWQGRPALTPDTDQGRSG
jgi:hypothetical protein